MDDYGWIRIWKKRLQASHQVEMMKDTPSPFPPSHMACPPTITSVLSAAVGSLASSSKCSHWERTETAGPGSKKKMQELGVISLIYTLHRRGSKMMLWGTPQKRSQRDDKHSSITTLWDLPAKKEQNHYHPLEWCPLEGSYCHYACCWCTSMKGASFLFLWWWHTDIVTQMSSLMLTNSARQWACHLSGWQSDIKGLSEIVFIMASHCLLPLFPLPI